MSNKLTKEDKKFITINGLGFWSILFIFKFGLLFFSFINFDFVPNVLLCLAMTLSIKKRFINVLYQLCLGILAIALLYHDSYLPSISQILNQKNNIQGFSLSYIVDFITDFVNPNMIYALLFITICVFFLREWIRVTTLVFIGFIYIFYSSFQAWMPEKVENLTTQNTKKYENMDEFNDIDDIPAQTGDYSNANLNKYLESFNKFEQTRKIEYPEQLNTGFTPFNIVILNICSMSKDDINFSGLEAHPVFSKFDISLEHFNSVSSYSTPASLRLLRSNCGQETEGEMYAGRKPECELLTSLENIGFKPRLFMDHDGTYGEYLKTLREIAGLNADLNDLNKLQVSYKSFDGTPIYSDSDLFNYYMKTVGATSSNSVSFFNLITLHDGNRSANGKNKENYGNRLGILLNDIEGFIKHLESNNRQTLLIMVPEHGAALRGDKMQISRLREIPTSKITDIPVYIKFIGLKNKIKSINLAGNYSYLALSELIKRTINTNFFVSNQKVNVLLENLPQTAPVAESTNAFFMRFKSKNMFKLKGDEWTPYTE